MGAPPRWNAAVRIVIMKKNPQPEGIEIADDLLAKIETLQNA
jgi:hypothetical protein